MTAKTQQSLELMGQTLLPAVELVSGGHFCPPEPTRIRSAGQECPTLADSDRQECLPHRNATARRGFSFTEILFAVMILGIGFIMVAAVFPVAIKQTEETVEETTAASVAKSGASYMGRIGIGINFPPTVALPAAWSSATSYVVGNTVTYSVVGNPVIYYYVALAASTNVAPNSNATTWGGVTTVGACVPYTGYSPPAYTTANSISTPAFWQLLSGNLILPTDNRYAWVPFYSRGYVNGTPAPYAQITMVAVQCRNGPNYTVADLNPIAGQANLQGRSLTAAFAPGGTNPDTISFSAGPTGAIAEGTYVLVANDGQSTNSTNGYVYRVGNLISGTQWELMPGGDMKNARYTPPLGGPVKVFVVGRGFNNPAGSDATFAGPAMDIGTFSSFIWIH